MINITPQANKSEPDKTLPLLYRKVIDEIEGRARRKGIIRYIPYPEVYHTLSWWFHLNKKEALELFDELKAAGILEVVPFHGIRIIKNQ